MDLPTYEEARAWSAKRERSFAWFGGFCWGAAIAALIAIVIWKFRLL